MINDNRQDEVKAETTKRKTIFDEVDNWGRDKIVKYYYTDGLKYWFWVYFVLILNYIPDQIYYWKTRRAVNFMFKAHNWNHNKPQTK